jgi:hypothetical protein
MVPSSRFREDILGLEGPSAGSDVVFSNPPKPPAGSDCSGSSGTRNASTSPTMRCATDELATLNPKLKQLKLCSASAGGV